MSHNERQMDFADMYAAEQLRKIHLLSDFLPRLKAMIPWEKFRETLRGIHEKQEKTGMGAPAYDVLFMFKILVLQTVHNLSDDQTELQIRDRMSFRHFLDLSMSDRVPDAKTIWLFKEKCKNAELEQVLFDRFHEILAENGVTLKSGLIVDSSFIEVPRRRCTKEENEAIKRGEIPESISENHRRAAQTDCDAMLTYKNNESHFGYKDHVAGDSATKFIATFAVTPANVHDGQPFWDTVPEKAEPDGQPVHADSAYMSAANDAELRRRGYTPEICERGVRGKPLTDEQKESNRVKSKIRCRVEHIFGAMVAHGIGTTLRTIGFARARFGIGIRNLVYNISRFITIRTRRRRKLHLKRCFA